MSSNDLKVRYLEVSPIDNSRTSLAINGISIFNSNVNITSNVNIILGNNSNIVVSNINGSTFGTDPDQKLSFYGATPVAQHSSAGELNGTIIGDDLLYILKSSSSYSGNFGTTYYTINDIVKSLKQIGILAP